MAEKIDPPVMDTDVPTAAQLVEELKIFGPEPEVLKLSIGDVLVTSMKMGQIRKMMEIASDLFPAMMMLAEDVKTTGEINVTALGEIAGGRFFELIGIACKRQPEELDELDPDEFVQLVAKILVVNMSFFGQRLPQMLASAKESVNREAVRSGVGPMLSKSSLGTAISSSISASTPTTSS